MKSIFQLCLLTSVRQLMPFLVLGIAFLCPYLFTEFTNYDVDPDVLAPARMQAAWQLSWVLSAFWLLFYSASSGSHIVSSRLGEYFQSSGVSGSNQLLGVWLSSMVYVVLLALVPSIICFFMLLGESSFLEHWSVLILQHFILMVLTLAGVSSLSVAVGSRYGVTVGYFASLTLLAIGLYFVLAVEKLVVAKDLFVTDILYVTMPHFYLSDLTHRFVHQQGPLSSAEFFAVFEYLSGWTLLLSALSCVIFTPQKK